MKIFLIGALLLARLLPAEPVNTKNTTVKKTHRSYPVQKQTDDMWKKVSELPRINDDIRNEFWERIGRIGKLDSADDFDGLIAEAESLLKYIESLRGKEIADGVILYKDSSFEAFGHLELAKAYDRKRMCFHAQYHHSIARDITAIDSTYVALPNLMVINPAQDAVLYKYLKNADMDGLLGLPPYLPTHCFTGRSYNVPFYKLVDPVNVDSVE